jgi:hypothetical protein
MSPFIGYTTNCLVSKSIQENTLKIAFHVIENCETNFHFDVHFSKNQDSCFLEYHNKPIIVNENDPIKISLETISTCDCFFNIELQIDSVAKLPSVILFKKIEEKHSPNINYQVLIESKYNGLPIIPKKFKKKSKTYNQTDADGNKIGIWKSENERFEIYEYYISSEIGKTRKHWQVTFNKKDRSEKVYVFSTKNSYTVLSGEELKRLDEKIEIMRKSNYSN